MGLQSRSRKAIADIADKGRPADIDRRLQLVQIAFNHIATKGFEGLRFQEVAMEAGVNNATLYYYFRSKEALIKGVTDFLMEGLKAPASSPESQPANALDELRQVFEGMRRRVTSDPAFFVVITELALRAKRDAAIDRIGQQRDDFWSHHLFGILERGISEGLFRPDIHVESAVAALQVQLKGIAHHAAMRKRRPGEIDAIVSAIAAQVEHSLTCPAAASNSGNPVELRAGTETRKAKR